MLAKAIYRAVSQVAGYSFDYVVRKGMRLLFEGKGEPGPSQSLRGIRSLSCRELGKKILTTVVICILCSCGSGGGGSLPPIRDVVIQPDEDTVTLYANPGTGWQTFHKPACAIEGTPWVGDPNVKNYGIPSATVYRRFDWDELELRDGNFDFNHLLEVWLQWAKTCGQRLALRVQLAADSWQAAPLWLRDKPDVTGYVYCRGQNCSQNPNAANFWTPDLNNAAVLVYHDRLVQTLAVNYDGHPFVDLIDIGSVGLWGEWQYSGTEIVACTPPGPNCPLGQEIPLPSESVRQSIINTWANAFTKTPLVMNVFDDRYYDTDPFGTHPDLGDDLVYALSQHRLGWRGDCWGHWFAHQRFYAGILQATDAKTGGLASRAWQDGAVALEPCGTMEDWQQRPGEYFGGGNGETLNTVLQWAIDHHATYIQNKDGIIPPDWVPAVKETLRKIGYRLVLRELRHPGIARRGSLLPITMTWSNVGVAPPYWGYYVQVRLKRGTVEWVSPRLLTIKGWQPGTRVENVTISLPQNLGAGEYELSLGIFSPFADDPDPNRRHTHPNLKFVKLAIQAPHDENGWYTLSRITLSP